MERKVLEKEDENDSCNFPDGIYNPLMYMALPLGIRSPLQDVLGRMSAECVLSARPFPSFPCGGKFDECLEKLAKAAAEIHVGFLEELEK